MKIHSLFLEDGQPNDAAIKMIRLAALEADYLDDEQMLEFLNEMKKAPVSERSFFEVPNIQFDTSNSSEHTIVTIILKTAKINAFSKFGSVVPKRMIPSLSMMQAYLKVKFGENAVKINPVLGMTNPKEMDKVDSRDMALQFPGVKLFSYADNYRAPWYDFTYHDFYHAIVCSSIPRAYRIELIELGKLASQECARKGYIKGSPEWDTLHVIAQTCNDMDFDLFTASNSFISNEEKLLLSLGRHLCHPVTDKRYPKYDLKTALDFSQLLVDRLFVNTINLKFTKKMLVKAILQVDKTPAVGYVKYILIHMLIHLRKLTEDPSLQLPMDENFHQKHSQGIEYGLLDLLNKEKPKFPGDASIFPELEELYRNSQDSLTVLNYSGLSLFERTYGKDQYDEMIKHAAEIYWFALNGVKLHQIMELEKAKRLALYQNAETLAGFLFARVPFNKINEPYGNLLHIPKGSNIETELQNFKEILMHNNKDYAFTARLVGPSVFTACSPIEKPSEAKRIFKEYENPQSKEYEGDQLANDEYSAEIVPESEGYEGDQLANDEHSADIVSEVDLGTIVEPIGFVA